MKNLLRCHDDNTDQALNLAIETVGIADDHNLTKTLIENLMGETDGAPKVTSALSRKNAVFVCGTSRITKNIAMFTNCLNEAKL